MTNKKLIEKLDVLATYFTLAALDVAKESIDTKKRGKIGEAQC